MRALHVNKDGGCENDKPRGPVGFVAKTSDGISEASRTQFPAVILLFRSFSVLYLYFDHIPLSLSFHSFFVSNHLSSGCY